MVLGQIFFEKVENGLNLIYGLKRKCQIGDGLGSINFGKMYYRRGVMGQNFVNMSDRRGVLGKKFGKMSNRRGVLGQNFRKS